MLMTVRSRFFARPDSYVNDRLEYMSRFDQFDSSDSNGTIISIIAGFITPSTTTYDQSQPYILGNAATMFSRDDVTRVRNTLKPSRLSPLHPSPQVLSLNQEHRL